MDAEEKLTPREAQVMRERFDNNCTLEEVARKFNVTRERIRRIEASALRKVRKEETQKGGNHGCR